MSETISAPCRCGHGKHQHSEGRCIYKPLCSCPGFHQLPPNATLAWHGRLEQAEMVANSMQHFADVAERLESKLNAAWTLVENWEREGFPDLASLALDDLRAALSGKTPALPQAAEASARQVEEEEK